MKTKFFIVLLFSTIFVSCATKSHVEYVDREVVKYDTKIQHDTMINNVRDSVFYAIYTKGDTVYETKYVEKVKYHDVIYCYMDTIFQDNFITLTKEVVVEKAKTPRWCYYCLMFSIFFLAITIIKVFQWLR